ncbi:MAG: cytochrome b/b6 domain-containing protein [Gammaproteobacteria bacterium]|jgi:Ni/Fe-hydrogenase 1 B-type cytochrome subunit|nr:cytochrome b/b6 domain-containing protein [Gammaproteobacteria bacterium]
MTTKLRRFKVWDPGVRLFHWLNALLVLGLMIIGILILNAKTLGIAGDAKILLKTIHSYTGYAFAINLGWRLIWAFIGNHYARWRQFLPIGSNYLHSFKSYCASLRSTNHQRYLGHNPIARIIISIFFLLLTSQAITGLIIAGTDLYLPPFGSYFAEWVTEADPQRLEQLKPGDKTYVVEAAYEEMRAFRKPLIILHVYGFYALLSLVIVHIAGVIVSEFREKNDLISAMITGEKILDGQAEDENDNNL